MKKGICLLLLLAMAASEIAARGAHESRAAGLLFPLNSLRGFAGIPASRRRPGGN